MQTGRLNEGVREKAWCCRLVSLKQTLRASLGYKRLGGDQPLGMEVGGDRKGRGECGTAVPADAALTSSQAGEGTLTNGLGPSWVQTAGLFNLTSLRHRMLPACGAVVPKGVNSWMPSAVTFPRAEGSASPRPGLDMHIHRVKTVLKPGGNDEPQTACDLCPETCRPNTAGKRRVQPFPIKESGSLPGGGRI